MKETSLLLKQVTIRNASKDALNSNIKKMANSIVVNNALNSMLQTG